MHDSQGLVCAFVNIITPWSWLIVFCRRQYSVYMCRALVRPISGDIEVISPTRKGEMTSTYCFCIISCVTCIIVSPVSLLTVPPIFFVVIGLATVLDEYVVYSRNGAGEILTDRDGNDIIRLWVCVKQVIIRDGYVSQGRFSLVPGGLLVPPFCWSVLVTWHQLATNCIQGMHSMDNCICCSTRIEYYGFIIVDHLLNTVVTSFISVSK